MALPQQTPKAWVHTIERIKSILTLSLITASQHASSPVGLIPPRRTRLRGFSRVFPKGITVQITQLRALSGSTPCEVNKKDGQLSLTVLTCFGGPSGVQPAAQASAAALRALRAALANAYAFTQLRALSGSTP